MSSDLCFRDADPSEDDELARIMYNAFLPIWDHNWFQNLSAPLAPIPSNSTFGPLSHLQSRRLAFYRSWLTLNRAYKGDIIVAYTPTSSSIAAIALLLPPHARPAWCDPLPALRTGFFTSLLGLGARGFWRICFTLESNMLRMVARGLQELGIEHGDEERLVYVQGVVRNPEWAGGKGPARRLLDWGIRRYWEREGARGGGGEKVPVWLDTTTEEGVRAYEAIGFRVLGECRVETGADGRGIKLGKEAGEKEREEGRKVARQRVMVRLPEEWGKDSVDH